MGEHNANEEERPSRLRRVYTEYCQPFYKRYRKFILAALGAAIVALQSAITDGTVTNDEWLTIAIAAATAAGVWKVPNATNKKVVKADDNLQ